MRRLSLLITAISFLLLFGAPISQATAPQDGGHTSNDPWTCKKCAPALEKALDYLKKKGSGSDGYRACLMGFVYLASGKHPKELQKCINKVTGGFYKQGGFNGNWAMAMAAIFMSEYYKRFPTEKVRSKFLDLMDYSTKTIETTGGWCHSLEMWKKNNYHKIGGGKDLGILTGMMFGAMLNMKKAGVKIDPELLKKVQKNCEDNSDGMGITYGTMNKWGDIAMGRGAWAWMGISYANWTQTKLYKTIPRGLKSRYKATDSGHAYPPVHYTPVAIAMHLLGPQEYDKFFKHWADKLIALQKADGSIELPHTEGKDTQKQDNFVGGTASFALILLLQKPGLLKPKKGKGDKGNSTASGGGIFGGKNKPTKDGVPWLGLHVKTSGFGLAIDSIEAKSPCKDSFKVGDMIVSFNGKTFDDLDGLKALVAKSTPGKNVKITVLRAGEKKVLTVKMGSFKKNTLGTTNLDADEI